MKKKFLFPILLLLCLFHGIVYAEPNAESEKTETITLTEENRYDPVYYQEPEEIYPAASAKMGRSTELSLEDYVVSALENFQTEIDVSAYAIPSEEASERYFQILNSHPSLFYVVGSVGWSNNPSTNMVTGYSVKYTDTEENIRVQQIEFNREVKRALTWVDSSMTDVEKALAVHDYLVLDCEYDYERLQNKTVPNVSHSAYGALINKMAVCDGYAKAYSCILDELGISSTIVSSDSMNHAWNMVSIGGEWYHVDATWDDPTWDSIGRVGHNYFLLSDNVISDSGHKHTGWSSGYTADSAAYDSEFWSEVTSAFCYQNGTWYYSQYNTEDRKTNLIQREGHLLDASESILYAEEMTWNNYLAGYMCLDLEPQNKEIYFNTRTEICKLGEGKAIITVHVPECPEGQLIFGFTVRGAQLCYALQETPNLKSKQVVSAYTVEGLQQLLQIEGITVENQEADYDGTAKQIKIEGTLEGDRITYKHEDDVYRLGQPEMKNAGTYQVWYKIEREGYETYTGEATLVIRKVKPVYTTPTGLKGNSGSLLSQIELPSGFVWEDGTTKLREVGEKTFYVSYMLDVQNYEIISNIPVTVTVSCSHDYIRKITVAATETQAGNASYTCSLCGHTYNEEIPKLKPDDAGDSEDPKDEEGIDKVGDSITPKKPSKVSSLKVSNATTSSLKFSWKKVKGVKYRLVLYKGNAAVSTIYTEGSSCTCKKLKAATLYTVKVTSYVESNGTKVYAASDVSLKVATAPAKAKLVSVKQNGSSKAKITWKKVTGADGYEISMRTGKGSYKSIKTITKGKTITFTKSGLKKGKSYSFRIRAYKKAGSKKTYGSYSNVKTLKIK